MSTVSVIVPVYNVEKYLRRCVESILAQTFTDFELILVDDGSTDNCPEICDEYARKDNRVRVIHCVNGGVSAARNVALEIASGEFLTFCDSDDYLKPEWFDWLVSQMDQKNVDMVIGNFVSVDDNGQAEPNKCTYKTDLVTFASQSDRVNYIIQKLLRGYSAWAVWARLFRTDIIKENCIRFCTTCGNYAEDLEFVLDYMLYADSVYLGDYAGYCYYQRLGSMMSRSQNMIKLNEVNEVSYCFWNRFNQVISEDSCINEYPIIHFQILCSQYRRLLYHDGIGNLPEEIKKIEKQKWYKKETKRIFSCYKSLKKYFGKEITLRIFLLSHYCIHRSRRLFTIESAILYKWILKGNNDS